MGKNLLNSIKAARPGYNRFDLTHDIKLSMNFGQLVPVCYQDVTPGDKWKIGCQSLIRFQPLIAPVMHRMDATIHYFFVPYRILWDKWETWITHGGADPSNFGDPLPAFPYISMGGSGAEAEQWQNGSLADYLGIPNPDQSGNTTRTEKLSAMPFAAYQKIWNEFYRDENLQNELETILGDGDNSAGFSLLWGVLRRRAWEHDYFTSCLPFAQKGPTVDVPLGDVLLKDDVTGTPGLIRDLARASHDTGVNSLKSDSVGTLTQTGGVTPPLVYDPNGSLEASPTSINDLRRAYALQRYFEKLARGGSRLKEFIQSMFGVNTGDARLQRPEYITGVKSPVVISEILNSTGTDALPQGNMAGHGISVVNGKYGSYFAREHGCIMGLMSIMPKTSYQNGIERFWKKYNDPTEYFTPDFAHIGEQETYNYEIYGFQTEAGGSQVFGYLPRYTEYKYANSRVAGDMRGNLKFWTMTRDFGTTPPGLNSDFIQCVNDDRQFAVIDETSQKLIVHVLNDLSVARMMPKYGTPTF